ncbi:unnamed protein product [Aphanomyces euteiches]
MAPIWAYIVLALAITTMSTGGMWFALFPETPPLMQSCWRLSLTSAMQGLGVAYELQSKSASLDELFWIRYRQSIPLLMVIGAAMGVCFGAWGWSVAHTTLLDSLLLVSTTPLLLVIVLTLRWLYRRSFTSDQREIVALSKETDAILGSSPSPSLFEAVVCPAEAHPPSWKEVVGTIVGFSGVIVLLVATTDENATSTQVTFAGNVSALIAALMNIVYLEGGSSCRKWMPLFIYSLSVTVIGAVSLGTASLLFEADTTVFGLGSTSLFGYFGDSRRFGFTFGSAFVAGFFGHACMNIAVVHVSTLLVAVSCLWEPLIGSYMGYLAGVQGMPDSTTLIAAPLLLGGALLVTLGGHQANVNAIALEGGV